MVVLFFSQIVKEDRIKQRKQLRQMDGVSQCVRERRNKKDGQEKARWVTGFRRQQRPPEDTQRTDFTAPAAVPVQRALRPLPRLYLTITFSHFVQLLTPNPYLLSV